VLRFAIFLNLAVMEVLTFVLLLTAGIITYIIIATLRSIFWPPKAVRLEYTPQQVGSITLEELSKCNGLDPTRPILFSVRGKIYDATESRDFYGPGGAYHVFAGREIARALGKMAIVEAECRGDIEDLTPRELSILNDWVDKFNQKYTVVGQVRRCRMRSLLITGCIVSLNSCEHFQIIHCKFRWWPQST